METEGHGFNVLQATHESPSLHYGHYHLSKPSTVKFLLSEKPAVIRHRSSHQNPMMLELPTAEPHRPVKTTGREEYSDTDARSVYISGEFGDDLRHHMVCYTETSGKSCVEIVWKRAGTFRKYLTGD